MLSRYAVVLSILVLVACKQDEKPQEEPKAPDRPIIGFSVTQEMIDSILVLPAEQRPTNPDTAAQYYLSFPPKVPIPPHFLPAQKIAQSRAQGDTVYYKFMAPNAPVWGEMSLARVTNGKDTAWVVTGFEHLPPQ